MSEKIAKNPKRESSATAFLAELKPNKGNRHANLVPIALACQGGGSHAAYGAGALYGLLRDTRFAHYDVIALSGTSGGAVCAALVWSGFMMPDAGIAKLDPAFPALVQALEDCFGGGATAEAERRLTAAARLKGFWDELCSWGNPDLPFNQAAVGFAEYSPWQTDFMPPGVKWYTRQRMEGLLKRHVVLPAVCGKLPRLLLGATCIDEGRRTVLPPPTRLLHIDDIIASASIPPVFDPTSVPDVPTSFWDGLFTTNPPLRDLLQGPEEHDKPHEIWLVRINPVQGEVHPWSLSEVADRRNELAGNTALSAELSMIDTVNDLVEVAKHPVTTAFGKTYHHVHIVEIAAPTMPLDFASKYSIDPVQKGQLWAAGHMAAGVKLGLQPQYWTPTDCPRAIANLCPIGC